MLRSGLCGLMVLGSAAGFIGCSQEEKSPEDIWGKETQEVRKKIFRDGTLTRKLNRYRMDTGSYPTTEQGLDALFNRPKGVPAKDWQGPYADTEEDVTDVWGNRFGYACPGKTYPDQNDQFDLWSFGPDGADGTDDDLLNHNINFK